MKLHIGSRTHAEGWISFDIAPGPGVDFVGDCKDLSQFADNSIDTIYASHVLEHIPYREELSVTLKEWFRALKPNGIAMVSVPDLQTLCYLFLRPDLDFNSRFHIMRMMFGGQTDAHDFHHVGFTREFLCSYLSEAGFTDIRQVQDFGIFNDTSNLRFAGLLISLNMTARKPC